MDNLDYGSWAIDFSAGRHVCTKSEVMKPQADRCSWAVDLPAVVRSDRTCRPHLTELRKLELHDVERKSNTGNGFSLISEPKLLSEGFTASWDERRLKVEYKDQEGNIRLLAYNDWHLFGLDQTGMRVQVAPVRLRQRQETK